MKRSRKALPKKKKMQGGLIMAFNTMGQAMSKAGKRFSKPKKVRRIQKPEPVDNWGEHFMH